MRHRKTSASAPVCLHISYPLLFHRGHDHKTFLAEPAAFLFHPVLFTDHHGHHCLFLLLFFDCFFSLIGAAYTACKTAVFGRSTGNLLSGSCMRGPALLGRPVSSPNGNRTRVFGATVRCTGLCTIELNSFLCSPDPLKNRIPDKPVLPERFELSLRRV